MKKSVLLLTTSALLSISMLGACGKDKSSDTTPSEESSEPFVDPTESWPMKAWSDGEKSLIETQLGVGNVFPFYYIEGQEVAKKTVKVNGVNTKAVTVTCDDPDKFSTSDLSGYISIFKRYGYSARSDSDASTGTIHYRVKKASTYVHDTFLDVTVVCGNSKWVVTAFMGNEVKDHSFAGRNYDYGETPFKTTSKRVETYFKDSGVSSILSLPYELADETCDAIKAVDFIDYRYMTAYLNANPETGDDGNTPEAEFYTDIGEPYASIIYTTTFNANINPAFEALTETYGSVGFASLNQNDKEGSPLFLYRNSSGFEVDFVKGKENEDDSIAARVSALIKYREVHDYSGRYVQLNDESDLSVLGVAPVVEGYFNAEKGSEDPAFVFPVLSKDTTSASSVFRFDVKDNRYESWKSSGTVGKASMAVTVTDLAQSESEVVSALETAGFEEAVADSGIYRLGDFQCTFTYTAKQTSPTVKPAKLVLNFTYEGAE